MLCLELDDLDEQVKKIPWLSHNRFNLFSIQDKDHVNLGLAGGIRANLTEWLFRQGRVLPDACRIQLVTFPSVLGYGFNPVSFYHIHGLEGEPIMAVAEVTNTYREMKLYLVPVAIEDKGFHQRIAKDFYVSPFSDPGIEFDFRLGIPSEDWTVHIDDYDNGECILLTTLHGRRKDFTAARLFWYSIKYPLLSLKIIALIHWHALLLWLRKLPFFRKSDRTERQLDVLRPHSSLVKTNHEFPR